ncbi:MAG: cytochrome c oxidase assembly protein [Actinomycetes bacterium]
MIEYPLLVLGLWGLWRLNLRRISVTNKLWLAAGSVLLVISAIPPFSTWAASSLPNHMISHIVLMFLAPLCLVASGEVPPLAKRIHPLVPLVVLNATMVIFHLPAVFDASMGSEVIRSLLVEPLFFLSGVWFFSVVLAPHSEQRPIQMRWQLGGVVLTTVVMFVLAMSMSIFTKTAWYHSMASMPGMEMPGDFGSQQLAAAILWICGDIWAVPLFVVLIRRLAARDGSLLQAVDRYASPSG